jgi:hypothetical protein
MHRIALLGMVLLAGAAWAQVSTYTDLRRCQVLGNQDEVTRRECFDAHRWQLRLDSDPDRERLAVVSFRRRAVPLPFDLLVQGGPASTIGPIVEWRGPAGSRPAALIVRYSHPDAENGAITRSHLFVVRLSIARDGVCVIGRVPGGPHQNEQARAIADRAFEAPCLPVPYGFTYEQP